MAKSPRQQLDELVELSRSAGFHNTNGLTGHLKAQMKEAVIGQNLSIMAWFLDRKRPATASQVHAGLIDKAMINPATPLTSTRRGMSNLSEWKYLDKMVARAESPMGKPEHYYQLHQKDPLRP